MTPNALPVLYTQQVHEEHHHHALEDNGLGHGVARQTLRHFPIRLGRRLPNGEFLALHDEHHRLLGVSEVWRHENQGRDYRNE